MKYRGRGEGQGRRKRRRERMEERKSQRMETEHNRIHRTDKHFEVVRMHIASSV